MGCTCVGEERPARSDQRGAVRGRDVQPIGAEPPPLHGRVGVRAQGRPARQRHRALPEAYEHTRPEGGGQHAAHAGQRAGRQGIASSRRRRTWASIWPSTRQDAEEILDDIKRREGGGLLLRGWPTARLRCCCNGISARTGRTSRWRASASSWTTTRTPARLAKGRHVGSHHQDPRGRPALRGHGRGRRPRRRARQRSAHSHRGVLPRSGRHRAGDYKVRILDENVGTERHASRHHHARQARQLGSTVGVSEGIIKHHGMRWSTRSSTA